jgi:hypothetical protein
MSAPRTHGLRTWVLSGWEIGAAPDDPLGPGAQDPDTIREAACELTAPDQVCVVRAPTDVSTSGGGGSGASSVIELLVWLVFIGLVAVLLALAVRAVAQRSGWRPRRRTATPDEVADEDVVELARTVVDHRRTPDDWRREAEEHRRAGRHRDALRCRYRALVGDLARRDVIDEIPGRTTGEERRQLSLVAPDRSESFHAAADLFDGAWYGHVEVGDRDLDTMIALESDVLQRTRPTDAIRTPS